MDLKTSSFCQKQQLIIIRETAARSPRAWLPVNVTQGNHVCSSLQQTCWGTRIEMYRAAHLHLAEITLKIRCCFGQRSPSPGLHLQLCCPLTFLWFASLPAFCFRGAFNSDLFCSSIICTDWPRPDSSKQHVISGGSVFLCTQHPSRGQAHVLVPSLPQACSQARTNLAYTQLLCYLLYNFDPVTAFIPLLFMGVLWWKPLSWRQLKTEF